MVSGRGPTRELNLDARSRVALEHTLDRPNQTGNGSSLVWGRHHVFPPKFAHEHFPASNGRYAICTSVGVLRLVWRRCRALDDGKCSLESQRAVLHLLELSIVSIVYLKRTGVLRRERNANKSRPFVGGKALPLGIASGRGVLGLPLDAVERRARGRDESRRLAALAHAHGRPLQQGPRASARGDFFHSVSTHFFFIESSEKNGFF